VPEGDGWSRWRNNVVVFGALDLLGQRLADAASLDGITFLAVGAGDPSWATEPPAVDRGRTALTAETYRKRLVPGRDVIHDHGRLRIRVTFEPGEATGTLREFGLFGGSASPRPRSGLLVNHRVHDAIDKAPDARLEREIELVLDRDLPAAARDLLGGLLAGERGLDGLTHVALGTSGAAAGQPAKTLKAEAYRKRLDRRAVRYDPASHAILAEATFDLAEGPPAIREAGIFGGTAADRPDTGQLLSRRVTEPIDRTVPRRLVERFEIFLVGRIDLVVPQVVGLTTAAANAALTAADLLPGSAQLRETDAAADGTVLEQAPIAGTVAPEGTRIDLVVASPVQVTIPAILGSPVELVAKALQQLGLKVPANLRESVASDSPPGTVIAANPRPGARVPKGTRVALTVAVPRQVTVPDLRGRTTATAVLVLRGLGLLVAPDPVTIEATSTPGTIVTQDPAAGAIADVGSAVKVTVAIPLTVAIPDLTGLTEDAAAAALAAAGAPLVAKLDPTSAIPGLALGARTTRQGGPRIGTVVSQAPAPGTRASIYATVDVTISIATQAPVPRVIGLDRAAANGALTIAGFTLGSETRRPDRAVAGTVVAQDPPAGTSWPSGARVSIVLADAILVQVPDVRNLAIDAAREAIVGRGLVAGVPQPLVTAGAPGTIVSQVPDPGTRVRASSEVGLVVRAGVPNLIGMTLADATAAVTAVGLRLSPVLEEAADPPLGVVLRQSPAAGSPADPGAAVEVVVSVAPGVDVPNLVGRAIDRAIELGARRGLVVAINEWRESDAPASTVLEQAPAAGSRAERGAAINVVIAVPLRRVARVPELLGVPFEKARLIAADAGLGIEVTATRPADIERDVVLEQVPRAGEEVEVGTVLRVVLSIQSDAVEVPDVRGRRADEAAAFLKELGLRLEVVDRRQSAQPDGTILDQVPVAGSRMPAGAVVTVVVSVMRMTVVPRLVGAQILVARNLIANAGLGLAVDQRIEPGRPVGTVLDQSPGPGVSVPVGTVVRLVVATSGQIFDRDLLREFERIDPVGPVIGGGGGRIIPGPGVVDSSVTERRVDLDRSINRDIIR
jgi:beta-lactam-binding protein with PASTA domain